MSKRRYHRRSKMKPRGVKNGSQNGSKNGSKMAPKWLQNGSLEASGRPLGPDPASRAFPERPGEALARPGASQKLSLAALGRPWSEQLIDFTLLEAPREGPGGALGGHFGSFLAVGPAGTKKGKTKQEKVRKNR